MEMLRLRDALFRRDENEYRADVLRLQILHDIAEAEEDLRSAWRQMNETTDNDLIDSAIFSVKAAESRYSALLKMLRQYSE